MTFGDYIFNNIHDAFFDVNKLRRFGFHDMHLDSLDGFIRILTSLKLNGLFRLNKIDCLL